MRPRQKTLAQLQADCDAFNAKHPVGNTVQYFREMHPRRNYMGTFRICGKAEVMGGHTAVVWLSGKSGCVAIDACAPADEAVKL